MVVGDLFLAHGLAERPDVLLFVELLDDLLADAQERGGLGPRPSEQRLLQEVELLAREGRVLDSGNQQDAAKQRIVVQLALLVERRRQKRVFQVVRHQSRYRVYDKLVKGLLPASELGFETKFLNSLLSD